MQEQIHDQEHQNHGFYEGMNYLFNGGVYKQCGIISYFVLNAAREILRQLFHTLFNGFSRSHGVGARGKEHADRHGGLIIVFTGKFIRLAAQLHTGHVF